MMSFVFCFCSWSSCCCWCCFVVVGVAVLFIACAFLFCIFSGLLLFLLSNVVVLAKVVLSLLCFCWRPCYKFGFLWVWKGCRGIYRTRSPAGQGGVSHVSPRARISHRTYRLANARGTLARCAIAFAKLYQIRKFVIVSFGSSKENKTPLKVNQCHPSHNKWPLSSAGVHRKKWSTGVDLATLKQTTEATSQAYFHLLIASFKPSSPNLTCLYSQYSSVTLLVNKRMMSTTYERQRPCVTWRREAACWRQAFTAARSSVSFAKALCPAKPLGSTSNSSSRSRNVIAVCQIWKIMESRKSAQNLFELLWFKPVVSLGINSDVGDHHQATTAKNSLQIWHHQQKRYVLI